METPWNIAPGRSSIPSYAEGPATDLLDLFSASGVFANPQAPPHRAQPLLVECACDLYFSCTILCKRNLELTMEPENDDYCKLKKWTLPNSFLRFHASFPSLKTATWFSKVKTTTWFFHCPVSAQKFHKQDSFLNKKPMFKWQTITYYLILLFLRASIIALCTCQNINEAPLSLFPIKSRANLSRHLHCSSVSPEGEPAHTTNRLGPWNGMQPYQETFNISQDLQNCMLYSYTVRAVTSRRVCLYTDPHRHLRMHTCRAGRWTNQGPDGHRLHCVRQSHSKMRSWDQNLPKLKAIGWVWSKLNIFLIHN